MSESAYTYTFNNQVFSDFVFYAILVLIKTVIMSSVTSFTRMKNKAYCSIEDAKVAAPNNPEEQKRLLRPNQNVERVRSAHLNDLENVIPFVIMGLLYVGTNPDPSVALWHFRAFVIARVMHSIVYVGGVRQPFRALCYFIGQFCFFSMAFRTLKLYY